MVHRSWLTLFVLLAMGAARLEAAPGERLDLREEAEERATLELVKQAPKKAALYGESLQLTAAPVPSPDLVPDGPLPQPPVTAVGFDDLPVASGSPGFLQSGRQSASPAALLATVRANMREGRFYASDFSLHPSPRAAIAHGVRPVDLRANVAGAARGAVHPVSLATALAAPMAIQVQRDLTSKGRVDFAAVSRAYQPGPLVGAIVGGAVGDVAGAAVQSTLGSVAGPAGPALGFVVRPLVAYAGYVAGSSFGSTCQSGRPSVKGALAESLRTVDPARDVGTVVGSTVGCVVGQALIPIPVVGAVAGSFVGGLVGTWAGHTLGTQSPLAPVNKNARNALARAASRLEGARPAPGRPAPRQRTPAAEPRVRVALLQIEARAGARGQALE